MEKDFHAAFAPFMIDLLNLNEISIWLQMAIVWKETEKTHGTLCSREGGVVNDLTAAKIQGVFLTQPAPSGVMMWPGSHMLRPEPLYTLLLNLRYCSIRPVPP